MLDMSLLIRSQKSSTHTFAERLKYIATVLHVYKKTCQDVMTDNNVFALVGSPLDRPRKALNSSHKGKKNNKSPTPRTKQSTKRSQESSMTVSYKPLEYLMMYAAKLRHSLGGVTIPGTSSNQTALIHRFANTTASSLDPCQLSVNILQLSMAC